MTFNIIVTNKVCKYIYFLFWGFLNLNMDKIFFNVKMCILSYFKSFITLLPNSKAPIDHSLCSQKILGISPDFFRSIDLI